MKDKMFLSQQLPAGSRCQGTNGTGWAQTSSRSGERRKARKKGQEHEIFSGDARGMRGGPWFQKGLLDSGVPAMSQGWEVILCGWATAGGSSNGEQGGCRGWARPQAPFHFPRLPSCPQVGKLRLNEPLYWNGLCRAACDLTLRLPDHPKLENPMDWGQGPQERGQEHHVNVVQGMS